MPEPISVPDIWKEIDASESFLVFCMFEDAASSASTVIQLINEDASIDDAQRAEMMESAGMVLVQSLKELGRISGIFIELKKLFDSVAMIPAPVFLTGVCLQISEGHITNLREILVEFLDEWKYTDEDVYVFSKAQAHISSHRSMQQSIMSIENYVSVAEVYAVTLLGMILRNPDVAISWTEKAELPEEKRQEMIGRLQSLQSVKTASPNNGMLNLPNGTGVFPASCINSTESGPPNPNGDNQNPDASRSIHPITKLISARAGSCFWWFHVQQLRIRNVLSVLHRGRFMLFGSLMFFAFYILQKRRAAIKRIIAKQVSSASRAMFDAWQLAFSVQVNPLAAVQPLPSARVSR